MREALSIRVKGIVQGVGFRPFVYRLACANHITGWVLNAVDGVTIHAEGKSDSLDAFVMGISEDAPSAARVSEIALQEVALQGFDSFEIRFSDASEAQQSTLVSSDLATCCDCERELFDPSDRRYRYPFINCTNCGPRFTITGKLPYDRPCTSMADFDMCSLCKTEYVNPADRRFHAQPDACFECGPHVSWTRRVSADFSIDGFDAADSTHWETCWGTTREKSDAIFAEAVSLLKSGAVLAVKGLGGFHAVCDAENPAAIAALRSRKKRTGRAFAVMVSCVEDARRVCEVGDEEAALLSGPQRPIVLLQKKPDVLLASGLADGLTELGVMLPYTPVQHLLMHDFVEAGGSMLVMTSGNLHDEPIVTDDAEAVSKLGVIADAILGNNRPILSRYDDSVVRVIDAGVAGSVVQFIRRARGYAPVPLKISSTHYMAGENDRDDNGMLCGEEDTRVVFAAGPEQKNTFCLLRADEAFVSQHIGDMENAETFDAWLEAKHRYEELFRLQSTLISCDMHPEYLPSKWAHSQNMPVVEVQHHHAHIVSVMAEHDLKDAVCGVAFDGTGYGVDGAIWGGEVMLANQRDFERFANFTYVPMPGGAAAVKNPLRMAYGVLWAYDLLEHPAAQAALKGLGGAETTFEQMIERGINTPVTSSVGRLFDAASALLGVCVNPTYEGEPAILLEAAMTSGVNALVKDKTNEVACSFGDTEAHDAAERYAIAITKNTATEVSTAQDTSVLLLDATPTFHALLDDIQAGIAVAIISKRFHDAFVGAIATVAELVRALYGIDTVVLSGGVFMNRYLMEHTLPTLAEAGFTVAVNRDLPPNDGCVSLGQAVVAWHAEQAK